LTSGQKVALSLLLTIFLFTGFVVLAFSGLYSIIETRFYQPSLIKNIESENKDISMAFMDYTLEHTEAFKKIIETEAIKSVSNPTQKNENIISRARILSEVSSHFSGLLGYKIIDTNGKYIHYSTFDSDILKQQSNAISYKNYDNESNIDYKEIVVGSLFFDSEKNQLIYSFPFINEYNTEQGRVLFYISASDFNRYLISKNLLAVNQNSVIIENYSKDKIGFIYGLPVSNQEFFEEAVLNRWKQGLFSPQQILDTSSEKWIAISDNSVKNFTVTKVEKESYFLFPFSVKILLLACIFISIYLIFFLLFNLKQDSMVMIKHKIKKFQLAFINQYLEKENISNWENLKKEIDKRKNDLSLEVKKSLGTKSKKHSKEIDSLLSKSWEDLLTILSARIEKKSPAIYQNNVDVNEIKALLQQIVTSGNNTLVQTENTKKSSQRVAEIEEIAPLEEVAEIEEIAPLGEASEIEEITPLEEVAEIQEITPLEEVSEIEEITPLEEVSEIEDITPLEEVAEIEEIAPLEEVTEIEDITPLEEVAEIEEITPLEEVAEIQEITPLEEVAEIQEIAPLEEVSEIEEITPLEEVAEIEDITPLEEVAEIQEIAPLEEISQSLGMPVLEDTSEFLELPEQNNNSVFEEIAITKKSSTVSGMPILEDAPELLEIPSPENCTKIEEIIATEEVSKKTEKNNGFSLEDLEELENQINQENIPNKQSFMSEPLIFSDIKPEQETFNSEETPEFEVFKLDFSYLDKNHEINSESSSEEVEEISPIEKSKFFSFTNYGVTKVIEELTSIDKEIPSIQEANGIFQINQNIDTSKVKIDIGFKELVESVMK